MRSLLLVLFTAQMGCMASSTPTNGSPRGSISSPTPAAGTSDIVATWEVLGYQAPSEQVATETGLAIGCGVTPADKSSEFWGRTIIVECPADTPEGSRILMLRDGTCSLVYPRPACGVGNICDPRPGVALAKCPPSPGSPRYAE